MGKRRCVRTNTKTIILLNSDEKNTQRTTASTVRGHFSPKKEFRFPPLFTFLQKTKNLLFPPKKKKHLIFLQKQNLPFPTKIIFYFHPLFIFLQKHRPQFIVSTKTIFCFSPLFIFLKKQKNQIFFFLQKQNIVFSPKITLIFIHCSFSSKNKNSSSLQNKIVFSPLFIFFHF